MKTKPKVKSEFTELIEIVSIPSPKGDLEITFKIIAGDDGNKFLDIAKMRGQHRISGVTMRLEHISIVREAMDAIDDAIKESESV